MADQDDLARDLLRLAEEDRAAVEALQEAGAVSDAIVGFHAQQATEKALKAILASRGVDFPFTHNVGLLLQLCEDAGLAVPEALAEADLLTPYGVTLRYGSGSPGTVDRATALALSDQGVSWARSVLG